LAANSIEQDVKQLKKKVTELEIRVQESVKEAMTDVKKDLAEFILQTRSK
jgi:hypothetical protein